MTKVVFETATIADAVKNADRVAPSKGLAYDKASGIVIEVDPSQTPAIVLKATNLEVFYREWVDAVEVTGDARTWRLPSRLLTAIISALPIGTGRNVTFEEETKGIQTHLIIKSGHTKAKLNLMMTELYPEWDVFDPDDLTPVMDLGGSISTVEWAAAKPPNPPLDSIMFDGEQVVATDRYRIAKSPVKINDAPDEVMVPAGILGTVLKRTGEVKVGFTDHQMLIMPTDTVQLRVVRYDGQYAKVGRIMISDRPDHVEVIKGEFLDMIRRTLAIAGSDRMPMLRLFLAKGQIAAMIEDPDDGYVGDRLDVPGQVDHARVEINFTPKNLVEAVEQAPGDKVTLGYDVSNPNGIMHVRGGAGYEAWVVTRTSKSE